MGTSWSRDPLGFQHRQLYSDAWLTKKLKKYPERSFFQIVTPSDIVYIISLVKNGKAMWDQEMDVVAKNQDDEGEGEVKEKKKARPLFTSGMGKKQSFGISLWNRVGLEYYHTAEDNWRTCSYATGGNVGNQRKRDTTSRRSRRGGRRNQ